MLLSTLFTPYRPKSLALARGLLYLTFTHTHTHTHTHTQEHEVVADHTRVLQKIRLQTVRKPTHVLKIGAQLAKHRATALFE